MWRPPEEGRLGVLEDGRLGVRLAGLEEVGREGTDAVADAGRSMSAGLCKVHTHDLSKPLHSSAWMD